MSAGIIVAMTKPEKPADRQLADRPAAGRQPAPARPAAGAKPMSAAQRAYEEKRAGKAGVSLDKHLAAKERRAAEEAMKSAPPKPPRKQGMLSRLLERANRPLGRKP